jgi:hypothetical protein
MICFIFAKTNCAVINNNHLHRLFALLNVSVDYVPRSRIADQRNMNYNCIKCWELPTLGASNFTLPPSIHGVLTISSLVKRRYNKLSDFLPTSIVSENDIVK